MEKMCIRDRLTAAAALEALHDVQKALHHAGLQHGIDYLSQLGHHLAHGRHVFSVFGGQGVVELHTCLLYTSRAFRPFELSKN